MDGKARGLLFVLALGTGFWGSWLPGHAQDLPPAPVPVTGGPPPALESSPPLPPGHFAPVLPPTPVPPPPPPAPPACAPYEDNNGPLLVGDPLLDRPDFPPPGWFFAAEIDLVGAHIKNRLTASVAFDTFTDQVHLPTAQLDGAGAPLLEIGCRLPQGFGEFLLSYRSVVTEGIDGIPIYDVLGDGILKSRLNVNVINLDYSSREFSLGGHWDMKWKVGVKLASIYFDSEAVGLFMEQRTSNDFRGIGPHVGLDLRRWLDSPGVALFARVEGASLVGQVRQSFEETFTFDDGSMIGAATLQEKTQAVPYLNVQVGVGWTLSSNHHWLRFATGYEFEQWWYLGQINDSKAELTVQGVFFRGEWAF